MFLAAALFACSSEHRQAIQELEDARAAWEVRGPSDYAYDFDQRAQMTFFVGPVAIEVVAHEVVAATVIDTGEAAPDSRWVTVDDLLDQVEAVIDARPYSFDVEYDPELGIPTSMHTEAARSMTDDVWSFTVDHFESRVEDG